VPYAPRFVLRSFDILPEHTKIGVLETLVEALVAANMAFLEAFPRTPLLYESGVRYLEEPRGRDDWQDIPETLARDKTGDCEDLAAWRIAELRFRGEAANPAIRASLIRGVLTYHVRVRRSDGSIEDPSRKLGMH
jgi:hypothetical protein